MTRRDFINGIASALVFANTSFGWGAPKPTDEPLRLSETAWRESTWDVPEPAGYLPYPAEEVLRTMAERIDLDIYDHYLKSGGLDNDGPGAHEAKGAAMPPKGSRPPDITITVPALRFEAVFE